MAKFINKKEQVFDLQLTPYAKYLMSIGKFKPAFYAFFDDNVLYDKNYATSSATEAQSDVDKRIKEETQYLETLVLFKDLETTKARNLDSEVDFILKPATNRIRYPDSDLFKIENAIGDGYYDGPSQTAPSWKIAALNSKITSSATYDTNTESDIPQISIESTYVKRVVNNSFVPDPQNVRQVSARTLGFIDQKAVELVSDDPVIYAEEVNTRTLMQNFDIEVFEIKTPSSKGVHAELKRLNFRKEKSNVENGFLIADSPIQGDTSELTTDDVEYYFDVLLDENVNEALACKGLDLFNKDSYYIDIDFDCFGDEQESIYYDIYGSTMEPEICQN
tara:strand:+ start:4284 stop:5285 length:1002 start_codon:yes stop_codon:yes gene_type:complete